MTQVLLGDFFWISGNWLCLEFGDLFMHIKRITLKGAESIFYIFLQAKMASEAQNKYERELMLHAADVEALQAIKEQVAKNAAVRQQLEDAAQKAESELLECKASWEERERMIKVWFVLWFQCFFFS